MESLRIVSLLISPLGISLWLKADHERQTLWNSNQLFGEAPGFGLRPRIGGLLIFVVSAQAAQAEDRQTTKKANPREKNDCYLYQAAIRSAANSLLAVLYAVSRSLGPDKA